MKFHVIFLFLSLIAFHVSAGAQEEIFLQLKNIEGSSTHADHKNWIEVQSWSFGVSNAGPYQGGTSMQSNVQDILFVKESDRSSKELLRHTMEGLKIEQAAMHFLKRQKGEFKVSVKMKLTGVRLTSFQLGSSTGGGGIIEQGSLTFDTISFTYFDDDGKAIGTYTWDRAGK